MAEAIVLDGSNDAPKLILEGVCPTGCGPIEPRREATLDFIEVETGETKTQRLAYCFGCEWWWGATVIDGEPHGYRFSDETVEREGYDWTWFGHSLADASCHANGEEA